MKVINDQAWHDNGFERALAWQREQREHKATRDENIAVARATATALDGNCLLFTFPGVTVKSAKKSKAKKTAPKVTKPQVEEDLGDPIADFVEQLIELTPWLTPARQEPARSLVAFYEERGYLTDKQVQFVSGLIKSAIKELEKLEAAEGKTGA